MNQILKASLLCVVMGMLMIVLQIIFGVQTAVAGGFVMGMAGGLFLAHAMTKTASPKIAA